MKPTTPFANNVHRRFRATGKVVARRPVTIGKEYAIGEEIPETALEPRSRWMLWEQGNIDTPEPEEPSEDELERLTAPAQSASQAVPGERVQVAPPAQKSPAKQQASARR